MVEWPASGLYDQVGRTYHLPVEVAAIKNSYNFWMRPTCQSKAAKPRISKLYPTWTLIVDATVKRGRKC